MIKTARMDIFKAKPEDIEFIMEMENHEDNKNYIWQGSYEQHLNEINDNEYLLLVFVERASNNKVGYALIHQDFKSDIFELRRIAINIKHKGFGREAMNAIIKYAFEETNTNRFWLDVYPDNEVGIHLYESIGLVREGILRENYKSTRGYLDQIVYSLLKNEYRK